MYPREFFDTYWRAAMREDVFVAMPFHSEFTVLWESAIRPAIEQDCQPALSAHRVDVSVLSGSVITDILDGIAHSRHILADISIAHEGRWRGQRNGNVMYEVGLAHAVRQNTEVFLVRSDDEEINFDVAGIRVHSYDPHDLVAVRNFLANLLGDGLRQIDHTKSLQVQKAIDALDADALEFVTSWGKEPGFHGPAPTNMGDALLSITKAAALSRLQSLGIVRCEPRHASGQPAFLWTEFGRAVVARLAMAAS